MRPTALSPAEIDAWRQVHSGWNYADGTVTRTFPFASYGKALGFVVTLGALAERRDHHPDLLLAWGKVTVSLTTHDAKAVTELDLDYAAAVDETFGAAS